MLGYIFQVISIYFYFLGILTSSREEKWERVLKELDRSFVSNNFYFNLQKRRDLHHLNALFSSKVMIF